MRRMTRLVAVLPKKYTSKTKALVGIRNLLETFAFEAQRELQDYPPAMPWKNPPPRTGLRKGGRRTGTLGRNWKIGGRSQLAIQVTNNTPYGSYVQGPAGKSGKAGGQTQVMADRGWPNVTEVGARSKKLAAETADLYPG